MAKLYLCSIDVYKKIKYNFLCTYVVVRDYEARIRKDTKNRGKISIVGISGW